MRGIDALSAGTGAAIGALVFLFALPSAAAAQNLSLTPGREVITRDELRAAGIQRLVDLIPWLGTATGAVEGLSWLSSLDELPPTGVLADGGAGWALLLDGQPIDIGAHGVVFPELIPVSLPQIDSVVVVRTGALVGGGFAERGAIQLHTSRVARGPALRVWVRNGAETGDPGPYAYTPKATPNVERSGPDGVATAAYGGKGWDLEVSGRYYRTGVSDSLLWDLHGRDPWVFTYARGGSARLGVEALGGRHQLIVARHNQTGNTYLANAGVLEQSDLSQYHAGVGGSIEIGSSGLVYRITRTRITSVTPAIADLAGERERLHGSAELHVSRGAWRLMSGLAVDAVTVQHGTPLPARKEKRTLPSLLASAEHRSENHSEQLTLSLTRAGGRIAERAGASVAWRIADGRFLRGSATYGSTLAEEAAAMAHSGSVPQHPARDSRVLRGSFGLTEALGDLLSVELSAFASSLQRSRAGDDQPPLEDAAPGRALAYGVAGGVTVGGESLLRGRLHYRGTRRPASSAAFGDAFEAIPAHHLNGTLAYRLHPSFRLGASVLLKSPTAWPTGPAGVGPAAAVGRISRLDLSIEKWFWKQRLRTQLIVGNALGTTERYHPLGADFAFRYFVGASLELPAAEGS